MRRQWCRSIAGLVAAAFALTSCAEFFDDLEIQVFEESADPQLRRTGEALREQQVEGEVQQLLDQFLSTGDRASLETANRLRPNDTGILAYMAALAHMDEQPIAIAEYSGALYLAEAKRLAAVDQDRATLTGTPPPKDPRRLRRNVLGELLVAQTKLLGGSFTAEWNPPPPNAPPQTKLLYLQYCDTRRTILNDYGEDLIHLPLPPC